MVHAQLTQDGFTSASVRRRDRREAILDVAAVCFRRDGFGGTPMSRIAAELGGSKGTLYNYFTSKEELFEAVVMRATSKFLGQFAHEPLAEEGARDRLVELACRIQDLILDPQAIALQRLVIAEGPRFPELAQLFYKAGPSILFELITSELDGLVAARRISPIDTKAAALQFKELAVGHLSHLELWGVTAEIGADERSATAFRAADLFLAAYGIQPV